MKYLILVFICSGCFLVSSSQTITNKINRVNRGDFKGNTIINRADTVFIGQLIINQKTNDSIYFIGTFTIYDTASKYYMTEYKFLPKSYAISFDVDVIISFDKPFTPWYITAPPPPNMLVPGWRNDIFRVSAANGEAKTTNIHTDDFKAIRVRGSVVGDNLNILVKSKERLYAKIESIYGAIGRK